MVRSRHVGIKVNYVYCDSNPDVAGVGEDGMVRPRLRIGPLAA